MVIRAGRAAIIAELNNKNRNFGKNTVEVFLL